MSNHDHIIDQEEAIVLNFDGLCEPVNPGGIATYGVVVKRGARKILEEAGLAQAEPWSDQASNNVAEYSAIIRGLEWLRDQGLSQSCVVIRGDSKLVISQLKGVFKVKAPRIVELYYKASQLISNFPDHHIVWVERSKNSEADLLSRIAYARYSKIYPRK